VAALPLEHRLASGVQLVLRDGLGIAGLGPLAIGYYDGQGTRYRLYAFAAADDGMARQAWKGVRGCPGALPVAGVGDEAVVVTPKAAAAGSPAREDVLARKGTLIAGIGDEELAQEGLAHPLTRSQKVATLRVWLDSRGSTHP
jgi:hypothetical protein